MPIINRVQGDLLSLFAQGEFDGIAQGCNCFHTMGAGIAAQIARHFPEAVGADILHHTRGDPAARGLMSMAEVMNRHTIYNLYTQYAPGRVSPLIHLYRDVHASFKALNLHLKGKDENHIGIPMIGAGIAGGNWLKLEAIISLASPNIKITVVEYKP